MNITVLTELTKVISSQWQKELFSIYDAPYFLELHRIVLTICWFGLAFLSILLKSKIQGTFGNLLHVLLFFPCNVLTLAVNFGLGYKMYQRLNTFEDWKILEKAHSVTCAFFSLILILQWLGGIGSMLGGNSYYHRRLGRPVAYLGMISAILGIVLAQQHNIAGILGIVLLVQIIILRSAKTRENPIKSKIRTSVQKLKQSKRD